MKLCYKLAENEISIERSSRNELFPKSGSQEFLPTQISSKSYSDVRFIHFIQRLTLFKKSEVLKPQQNLFIFKGNIYIAVLESSLYFTDTSRTKRSKPSSSLGVQLKSVESVKDREFTINYNLSWGKHVDYIVNKGKQSVRCN